MRRVDDPAIGAPERVDLHHLRIAQLEIENREIGCQIAGIGPKRVSAAGVDQDSAVGLLDDEGDHRGARVTLGARMFR